MDLNTEAKMLITALGMTMAMLVGTVAGSFEASMPMSDAEYNTLNCGMIATQASAAGVVDPKLIDDCLAEIKAQSAFSD